MHEIEVKAWAKNKEQVLAALNSCGVHLEEPLFQHDTVYLPGTWEGVREDPNLVVLRIRIQAGKAVLTLKKKE